MIKNYHHPAENHPADDDPEFLGQAAGAGVSMHSCVNSPES